MNIQQQIVLISAELSNEDSFFNSVRTERLINMVRDIGLNFGMVEGFYKGKAENTLLVVVNNQHDIDTLLGFAKNFKQESILHSDSNRHSELIYIDGRANESLGRLIGTSELEAKKSDSYTKSNDSYYITKKGA